MTPYYEHGGITIYHGDCREVLPSLDTNSVDLVLTDPPYVVKDKVEIGGKGVAPRLNASYTIGDQGWLLSKNWLIEASRICNRHAVVFGNYSDLADLLVDRGQGDLRGVFVWRKPNAALPAWNVPHYDTEFFLWWGRGNNPENIRTFTSMVYDCPFPVAGCFASERFIDANGKAEHPAQKPLKLMTKIVSAFAMPGQLILDVFMGSGTTLRAAKDAGCRAIGIEIEERYCEIAAKRLAQEVLPLECSA